MLTQTDPHQTMHFDIEISEECTACGMCIITCPSRYLIASVAMPISSKYSHCTGCLECVEVCPRDAISVLLN